MAHELRERDTEFITVFNFMCKYQVPRIFKIKIGKEETV